MRPDLAKVVTERPRSGIRYKTPKGSNRQWQKYEQDEYPKSEKIRQKWINSHTGGKEFTDVIGPLYGYLLKQVGRPWDKVFSEISQNLPQNTLQGRHIHTHIWQFVEKNVVLIDKKPCFSEGIAYGIPIYSNGKYDQLYVHPKTGLLCKAKKGPSRWHLQYSHRPDKYEPGIKVYPGVQYHKIKNVWYEVKVRKYPETKDVTTFGQISLKDVILDRYYNSEEELKQVYGGSYIAESKRLLTKKEIKFACLS